MTEEVELIREGTAVSSVAWPTMFFFGFRG